MLIWDSFIIYMSCPLNFPEPLPHISLPVFGGTSVNLILPTIQPRPIMEWKYKSRLSITLSFRAVKAETIWPHFSTEMGVCPKWEDGSPVAMWWSQRRALCQAEITSSHGFFCHGCGGKCFCFFLRSWALTSINACHFEHVLQWEKSVWYRNE